MFANALLLKVTKKYTFYVIVKSSQVTIICIALLTMQIVSKQLYISLI